MPVANEQTLKKKLTAGLAKIGLALKHEAWRGASPLGLTPTQGQVLALLRGNSRPLQLGEVATGLAVTAATVSEAVSALARKGLLEKKRQGRSLSLTLTPAGAAQAEAAASWPDFLAESLDELPEPQQAALLDVLLKVILSLQTRGRIPVSRLCATCTHFRRDAHPGEEKPNHCGLINAPLGPADLRLDCPEHVTGDGR